ncbi:hypothetical protein GR183_06510 [Stappia sp. GBMRC 2046]|uniref:Sulfotransferase family protein n=1 Tax=Stappia sediminis TaxID=2692190 RepID=A0A7X3LT14_9HYPH|nr:sulfotransferase family 2 domain-containing protein [Stappia sediminis]MXN64551.1 hypothetical protein [Stappia sediminis]
MLKSIYIALDRSRRPLRDRYCALVAEKDIALIRIPHAASMLQRHPLEYLVNGNDDRSPPASTRSKNGWIDGTQLVSPRELINRRNPALAFAIIRHPGHRLAACYRRQILERDTISDAWMLRGFRIDMSFHEFVRRACIIGDTRADNHTRSQTSLLSHKGNMLSAKLLRAEHLADDWENLRAALSRSRFSDVGPCPDIDEEKAFEDASLYDALPQVEKHRIGTRYFDDFQRFYKDAATGEDKREDLAPAYFGVQ